MLTKTKAVRFFNLRGLTLRPPAWTKLSEIIKSDPTVTVDDLLNTLTNYCKEKGETFITPDSVLEAFLQSNQLETDSSSSILSDNDLFSLISTESPFSSSFLTCNQSSFSFVSPSPTLISPSSSFRSRFVEHYYMHLKSLDFLGYNTPYNTIQGQFSSTVTPISSLGTSSSTVIAFGLLVLTDDSKVSMATGRSFKIC
ncbi:hypothetical protein GEMRC1_012595 [Eukaryota sp. GEM-RC1]